MYIVYERNQPKKQCSSRYIAFDNGKYGFYSPIQLTDVPIPKFKPTWLIRVSDMERVRGSTVDQHYWALSYSWNQSGEMIHKSDEKYDRVDEGKHQIIEYRRTWWWWSSSKKEVKFEDLIQQICTDAGVQYIWYDQMCIDQDNHEEKLREIKRMHLIYGNAFSALVLLPELGLIGDGNTSNPGKAMHANLIPYSQWSTRMWTLEEAYVSRNMLFIGRNAHFWSDDLVETNVHGTSALFIRNLQHGFKKEKWKASTALWHARTRTSSKTHDQIFALVNIFPELKDGITFNYKQPVRDLMIRFYGLLAQEDPSILAFGFSSLWVTEADELHIGRKKTIELPSWTGKNGVHMPQSCLKYVNESTTESYCCTVTGECMSLTSEFILVRMGTVISVEKDREFIYGARFLGKYNCAKDGIPYEYFRGRFAFTAHKTKTLTFCTTTDKARDLHSDEIAHSGLFATHFLPLIEENGVAVNTLSYPTCIGGVLSLTENPSDCVILTGLEFKLSMRDSCGPDDYFRCYPVVTEYKNHYRSIGLCFFDREVGFYSMVIQPKKTFCIR